MKSYKFYPSNTFKKVATLRQTKVQSENPNIILSPKKRQRDMPRSLGPATFYPMIAACLSSNFTSEHQKIDYSNKNKLKFICFT